MAKRKTDSPEFDEFWTLYPRAIGKPAALRSWNGALVRASSEVILTGLKDYPFSDDPAFIPYPATWLNQDRWIPAVIRPAPTTVVKQIESRASWRDAYDGGPALPRFEPGPMVPSHPGPTIDGDATIEERGREITGPTTSRQPGPRR